MDEPSRGAFIAAHIESIAARSHSEGHGLVASMLRGCWPGGPLDRSEPGALEWVRRWGPRGKAPPPLSCACDQGRCGVCN